MEAGAGFIPGLSGLEHQLWDLPRKPQEWGRSLSGSLFCGHKISKIEKPFFLWANQKKRKKKKRLLIAGKEALPSDGAEASL